jgi:hypothetical protein
VLFERLVELSKRLEARDLFRKSTQFAFIFAYLLCVLLLASSTQYYNSPLDRWFAERTNISEWRLDQNKLTDEDIVTVANIVKQNSEVGKTLDIGSKYNNNKVI